MAKSKFLSKFPRFWNILEEYQRDRLKLLSIRRSIETRRLEEYGEEEKSPVSIKISNVKLLTEMFEES